MGKTLKTAGAIIGGAVLVATGVGAIAGLQVTAIGIAGIGTASISSLQMASAGLMAVGGMLDKPKSQASANPTDWTSNPDQPTPFLFGRIGVTGKVVHRDEWGTDNHAQSFVHVYSGAGPVRSFVSFTADDIPVTFASNGGSATGKRSGQMFRSWRLGDQPDTALTPPSVGGPGMPMWGTAYKLSGKACDLWTLSQDSKLSVYPGNAEPKPLSVIEGIFGYDPRFDSTYPGGMGDCRLGVRSTYRWIENPIIAALNWTLGMVENGQVVGGVGVSPSGVDFPAFVDAANIADANGWKIAAWPDTSEDVSAVLDQMLQAGGAVRARHAGKVSCVSRGAPRPSLVTIRRDDTAGAIELDTGASRFNRLNMITPRFMSEQHRWQPTPAAPVSFAAYVTEDGGRRSDLIDYRFVPLVKQAAELAAYDILDAREPFSGTIPLKPHMRQLKRGDCFTIDEPGFMLDGVKCMVLSRGYDPKTGVVRIAFRSETDSKHPLALGKTTDLPTYPALTPPDPTEVTPPAPGDITVTPRPPAPGGQVPGFDLSIVVSNPTVTTVLVEFWEVPTGTDHTLPPPEGAAWQSAGIWPPTTTEVQVNVQPDRRYWFGLTYRRGENESTRTLSGPHLSPGLTSGGTTVPTDGVNRVPLSNFERNLFGWGIADAGGLSITLATGTALSRRYIETATTFFAADQAYTFGSSKRFPVQGGERLSCQAKADTRGVGTMYAAVNFFDAAGDYISTSFFGFAPPLTPYGTLLSDFVDVPANAVTGQMACQVVSTGSGSGGALLIEPMVSGANAGQTEHPPYTTGPIDLTEQVQWIDDTGRIRDGRGLPINAAAGRAIIITPAVRFEPGTPPDTAIVIKAITVKLVGGLTLSLPTLDLGGLAANTNYAIFRDLVANVYLPISGSIDDYALSPDRYLLLGYQRTALEAGGSYEPPPEPPPGGGGGEIGAPPPISDTPPE